MALVGGTKAPQAATAEHQALADKVKADAETKLGQKFGEFHVVSVSTQTVAGTNYFLKVNVGGGHFVHLRVFQGLPPQQHVELHSAQGGHTAESELKYF